MRRAILFTFVVLFAAPALFAGLAYNFESTTTGMSSTTMTGTVRVDGANVRVDVAQGDGMLFKNGSVIVSTDGGKTLSVFESASKSYFEMDLSDLLGDLAGMMKGFGGAMSMEVQNPRVNVRDGGEAGKLEGYAVRKSTVDSSYDLLVNVMGTKMPIRIAMTTDVFWTDALGAEFTSFMQMRGIRTGIDAVDKIIASQTSSIKGFPLKQVTVSRVDMNGNEVKSTTTSTVSGIRPTKIAATQFRVPEGYTKVDSPLQKMMRQFGGGR